MGAGCEIGPFAVVEAGAEIVMTQPVYDPRTLEDIVARLFPRIYWAEGRWISAGTIVPQPVEFSRTLA